MKQLFQRLIKNYYISGNYKIAGVPGEGAPILLKFKNLVGGVTGNYYLQTKIIININDIEVTCLDVSMPIVMAKATDFGIEGNETVFELNSNENLLKKIEKYVC